MQAFSLDPQFSIQDEDGLRSLFEPTHDLAVIKCRKTLSDHAKAFIGRSPFLCIGTQNADGRADVSPRGDPAGFVQVLDDKTLAIPDRPGNNRLDTLANVLGNPSIGLLFIIPGFEDTLRVNGRATLSTQPDLLNRMAVNGRCPKLAIVVHVDEIFFHCAKAFRRSHLWNPEHFQDRRQMPSLVQIILEETTGAPEGEAERRKLDDDLEEAYKRSLY
jgi:uncharacterized protein